ncbi:MAG: hypothetical protein LJE85_05175 [Gammaproteobacteria bacterium]|nr:hypothetical protein [Gammaproteobacteria bacterium]
MSNLLKINNDKYTYVDSEGVKQPDSLKEFKAMEEIYIAYSKPDLPSKKFSEKHLKVLLFLAFISEVNNNAAFLEYLAGDLMPIYGSNKKLFLDILNEQPFLIPAACDRLNAYFGFEGKNTNNKPDFLQQNVSDIKQELESKHAQLCLDQFK